MTNQFRAVSASRPQPPGSLVVSPVYPGQPRYQQQVQPQPSSGHTYYNTPTQAHASNQAGPNIMRQSRPEVWNIFDIFILLKSLIILLSLLWMSYVPDVTLWWLLLFQLPLYHDPRLPLGWRRDIQRAPSGECFVVLIHVSSGRTFRNREELKTYLVSSGAAGPDPGKVDFSVFGKVMWPEKHC